MKNLQAVLRLLPRPSTLSPSRHLLLAAILTGAAGLSQAGIFDTIKNAAEKVVEDVVDSTTDKAKDAVTEPDEPAPKTQSGDSSQVKGKPRQTKPSTASFSTAADVHGQWTGSLDDGSTNHALSSVGLEMLISDQVNVVRVSQMASRCLGDMTETGSPGRYQVEFMSGRELCGKNATIELAPNGELRMTWQNAPGAEGMAFRGKAQRTYAVYARNHWSSPPPDRKASDVVGFYPGMSYENAMANWAAQHTDLKRELRWVRDEGTSSEVAILTPKEKPKAGQRQLKEEITLGFESKSPAELPDVEGSQSAGNPEDLRRAGSELLYIYRHIVYADRKGPTMDTVKGVLIKKYGA